MARSACIRLRTIRKAMTTTPATTAPAKSIGRLNDAPATLAVAHSVQIEAASLPSVAAEQLGQVGVGTPMLTMQSQHHILSCFDVNTPLTFADVRLTGQPRALIVGAAELRSRNNGPTRSSS